MFKEISLLDNPIYFPLFPSAPLKLPGWWLALVCGVHHLGGREHLFSFICPLQVTLGSLTGVFPWTQIKGFQFFTQGTNHHFLLQDVCRCVSKTLLHACIAVLLPQRLSSALSWSLGASTSILPLRSLRALILIWTF